MSKPKKPITHVYNGEAKRGAQCRERVPFMLGEIRIWVACGWPKSAHRRRRS